MLQKELFFFTSSLHLPYRDLWFEKPTLPYLHLHSKRLIWYFSSLGYIYRIVCNYCTYRILLGPFYLHFYVLNKLHRLPIKPGSFLRIIFDHRVTGTVPHLLRRPCLILTQFSKNVRFFPLHPRWLYEFNFKIGVSYTQIHLSSYFFKQYRPVCLSSEFGPSPRPLLTVYIRWILKFLLS